MEKSHRESVLVTSCIQTPVHPHTRAPLTLYEREQEERFQPRSIRLETSPARRTLDEHDSNVTAEEDRYCEGWRCRDWVLDISKLHQSDNEYYVQVERLKNAHLQSMEQLEKMYENKLHLKGVYSIDNEQEGVQKNIRSAWDKKSLPPAEFDDLFLKHDLHSNATSQLSESDEDYSDSEGSLCARKKIVQMWNGFTVEDYIRNTDVQIRPKIKSKSKEWSHKITIPEPFQMTIRESKKREMNVKLKSEIELENILLKKKLEEEAECQKKFRAKPVPASVYLPLYHEIVERNEERRRFVKDKSKEILMASQKPFKFIEREERKKKVRKVHLMDLPNSLNNANHFKAKPVPKSIYGSTANERLKEEELYRGIRIQMRSQELLQSSSYPTSTLASRSSSGNRKIRCHEAKEKQEHKPKINPRVPNFEALHQKHHKHLLENKNAKQVTVCNPFHLRTDLIPSRKEKILRDIEADEKHLKETRWPYQSPRNQEQIKSSKMTLSPHEEEFLNTPRSTESSKRRQQAIRKSIEEKEKLEEEWKKRKANQKHKEKQMKKRISIRAKANDPHQSVAQMSHSKLRDLRKSEKQRTKEYFKELKAMVDRVHENPLLLERATQKNARLSAEKHYSNILQDLGLSEDFVSKKGRSTSVKDYVSASEKEFSTEDEESTDGTLEIEDLLDEEEKYNNDFEKVESEDEQQEYYSTDEDHSEDET
ncbi:protein FAM161A [Rhinophrynus dorsalis]